MSVSEGAIELIFKATQISELPHQPTLQVLWFKPLPGAGNKVRTSFSDGIYFLSNVILSGAAFELYQNGKMVQFSLVKVIKYVIGQKNNTRYILVVDLEVLNQNNSSKIPIGNPSDIASTSNVNDENAEPIKVAPIQNQNKPANSKMPVNTSKQTTASPTVPNSGGMQTHGKRGTSAQSHYDGVIVLPINSLTPYQSKWTIRARVDSKSTIRKFQNSKGEGKLFSVTLVDESGEIRATAFNECVDIFYSNLESKKFYYISGATLKVANKQYSSSHNEYEMTLNSTTVVKPCHDAVELPPQQYNFVTMANIPRCQKDSGIDVIGVINSVGEMQTINTKNGERKLNKRDVTIVDDTGYSVILTLWGNDASEENKYNHGDVLAIRNTKISIFRGISLTTTSGTDIDLNPNTTEANKLLTWFRNQAADYDFIPVAGLGQVETGGVVETPFMTLSQISSFQNMSMDKSEYMQVIGMLEALKGDNLMYKACPTPNCHKKVIEDGPNNYRCEKCNRNFNNYSPRFLANGKIVDCTSAHFTTFFNENVEKMLDVTPQEADQALVTDRNAYDEIITRARFKRYVFKLRLKLETFNDETRIKSSCMSLRPLNFVSDGRILLEKIKQLEST